MEVVSTAIVIIGRNEGERLKRCLRSLPPNIPAVYVDSGSTDGSIEFAKRRNVDVVELDQRNPFTAARARNVGWRALVSQHPELECIQFIDGDCELNPDWIDKARQTIGSEETLAAVFGRRREKHPERSLYNQICDDEWSGPAGYAEWCGGDVLFRVSALTQAGGYSDTLIAGEEPDLCLRLRRLGWRIRRIDAEMTLHDADITSFSAFWKRVKRSGFAYAEHVWRHGRTSIPSWRRQLYGIVAWGLLLPLLILTGLIVYLASREPLALATSCLGLAAYLLQTLRVMRNKRAEGADRKFSAAYGALIVSGKIAQASGVSRCWLGHLQGRDALLIEYKRT